MTSRIVALAVDLGGTKVEAGLVDDAGTVIEGSRHREPTGNTSDSNTLAAAVTRAVLGALATLPDGATLIGAGIGSAGPVNTPIGAVSPLNIPAWRNYPLRDLVSALVPGLPVTLR